MTNSNTIPVTSIPAIRYADANKAIDWLKQALGFTEKAVYRNASGAVEHAELLLGNGMVMIGTFGLIPETAHWFVQPGSLGGVTASVYLIVPDCEPVYALARAAGAEILQELETKEYGGKAFIVRDLEGQIWSVGEYNPWAAEMPAVTNRCSVKPNFGGL
jgi:uncharacterized glyoxalase superfamily protein PhnB